MKAQGEFSGKLPSASRKALSNLPVRIVALTLVAIFVPSLLITAVGLVAVYRAEPIIREHIADQSRDLINELEKSLNREWKFRFERYKSRLEDETEIDRYLWSLPILDDHVRSVTVLRTDGAPDPIKESSPLWELAAPQASDELKRAWELEFDGGDLTEARTLYSQLATDAEPETQVAALSGLARVSSKLGEREQAIRYLDWIYELYGLTVDETGMPRGIPALLRIIELCEESDPVTGRKTVDKLDTLLTALDPWLEPDVRTYFRKQLRASALALRRSDEHAADDEKTSKSSRVSATPGLLKALNRHVRTIVRDSGYASVALEDGSHVSLAYFVKHDPEDSEEQRVVYLELDPVAYLNDYRIFAPELKVVDKLLGFTDASGVPILRSEEREVGPLDRRFLPTPFEYVEMQYYPTAAQTPELKSLKTWEAAGFAWAIIVLVLTMSLGILVTLRAVLREMEVARLKSDFVSFITHELKTPLTAIRMFTETLLMGRAGDRKEQRKCIEMIDKQTERLSQLIQRVLHFARIEKDQQAFHFTTCDMPEVVQEALRIFRQNNPKSDVDIEVSQAQHISRIRMDRSAIVELVLNLLSNAYKYSRGKRKKITINLRESVDRIAVDVMDNGMGIPKSEQRKIFDKFYRAQDFLSRDIEGSGLGLSFAKYVAKVHNGDIKVSSIVDRGSTFTLELQKDRVISE